MIKHIYLEGRENLFVDPIISSFYNFSNVIPINISKIEKNNPTNLAIDEILVFVSEDANSIDNYIEKTEPKNIAFISSSFPKHMNKKFKSAIGLQRHLISNDSELPGSALYLGELKESVAITEPLIRECDLLIFDMNVLRKSELGINSKAGPSGIYSEEATQMFRYAGMSETNKFILIINYNNDFKDLVSQFLWYYSEAASRRFPDHPYFSSSVNEYVVNMKSLDKSISFFKSKVSGRWWVKIPEIQENKWKACNYEDYQQACEDDLSSNLLELISFPE